jgi:hypothetical protein
MPGYDPPLSFMLERPTLEPHNQAQQELSCVSGASIQHGLCPRAFILSGGVPGYSQHDRPEGAFDSADMYFFVVDDSLIPAFSFRVAKEKRRRINPRRRKRQAIVSILLPVQGRVVIITETGDVDPLFPFLHGIPEWEIFSANCVTKPEA